MLGIEEMRLSKNFKLEEFSRSQTAEDLNISNTIPEEIIPNIQELVDNVLQPVRDKFGPVIISSGYRCPKLNSVVGGSKTSEHLAGKAADFIVVDTPLKTVAFWIIDNCEFNQLILEYNKWLHCSYQFLNEKKVMTAESNFGVTRYLDGIA